MGRNIVYLLIPLLVLVILGLGYYFLGIFESGEGREDIVGKVEAYMEGYELYSYYNYKFLVATLEFLGGMYKGIVELTGEETPDLAKFRSRFEKFYRLADITREIYMYQKGDVTIYVFVLDKDCTRDIVKDKFIIIEPSQYLGKKVEPKEELKEFNIIDEKNLDGFTIYFGDTGAVVCRDKYLVYIYSPSSDEEKIFIQILKEEPKEAIRRGDGYYYEYGKVMEYYVEMPIVEIRFSDEKTCRAFEDNVNKLKQWSEQALSLSSEKMDEELKEIYEKSKNMYLENRDAIGIDCNNLRASYNVYKMGRLLASGLMLSSIYIALSGLLV